MNDNSNQNPSNKLPGINWLNIISCGCGIVTVFFIVLRFTCVEYRTNPPAFKLERSYLRPCDTIIIRAENKSADKFKDLEIEFDEIIFQRNARFIPNTKPVRWKFIPCSKENPESWQESFQNSGRHKIRFKFPGKIFSEYLTIYYNNKVPFVQGETYIDSNTANINGRAAAMIQVPGDSIKVKLIYAGNKENAIMLPVEIRYDFNAGVSFFYFKAKIDGIPHILPDDPEYYKPFLSIEICDGAGNSFTNTETYSKFLAQGSYSFSANHIADIIILNHKMENSGSRFLDVRIAPKKKMSIELLPNGKVALPLKVDLISQDRRKLSWENIPTPYGKKIPATNILRNEGNIALSFNTSLIDTIDTTNAEPKYRVEQAGADGILYSSASVKAPTPKYDSVSQGSASAESPTKARQSGATEDKKEAAIVDTQRLILEIRSVKDSVWINVFVDGQSSRLYVRANQTVRFAARDSLNVHVGNNADLRYILNGKSMYVKAKNVAVFKLSRGDLKPEMWTLTKWTTVFMDRL